MVQILDRDNCFCCQWRWYLRNIINIRNIIDIRYIANIRGSSSVYTWIQSKNSFRYNDFTAFNHIIYNRRLLNTCLNASFEIFQA